MHIQAGLQSFFVDCLLRSRSGYNYSNKSISLISPHIAFFCCCIKLCYAHQLHANNQDITDAIFLQLLWLPLTFSVVCFGDLVFFDFMFYLKLLLSLLHTFKSISSLELNHMGINERFYYSFKSYISIGL